MATKKTGFFSSFFRKKSNKENELPETQARDQFYRTQSVRGSRRPQRTSHFEDAGFSPEYPNPYHGNVKPRMHPKGPQSCPGGYRDESYHEEVYEDSRRHHGGHGRHDRADKYRRSARDTSEYGSGDPSPITMSSRHQHYINASVMDDSEDEERPKYGDLEKACDYYKAKYEQVCGRRDYYKNLSRKLKSSKEQNEEAFNDRVRTLKAENEQLRQQLGLAKAELTQMSRAHQQQQQYSFNQQSFYQQPPQMFSSTFANQQPYPNLFNTPRMSLPHQPLSTVTPGTSATLETTTSGAGEALAQPGDLSFRPSSTQFDSSFSHQEEDEDNIKNFSGLGLEDDRYEKARSSVSSSSLGISPRREVKLVRQTADDSRASSSTVIAEEEEACPPLKSSSGSTLRRTASDGLLN